MDASILGPVNLELHASKYDSIQVCESFAESLSALRECFAAFVRFYEDYGSEYEMTVWIAHDGDIDIAIERGGRSRNNFLGEWRYSDYTKLSRQIELWSNRTFVIRRDWLPKLREILVEENSP